MIFLIKYLANKIFIAEFDKDGFSPLKHKGEEWQKYDSNFWQWFKDKICYENEELSFALISDSEDFAFDKNLNIAKVNQIEFNLKAHSSIVKDSSMRLKLSFLPELNKKPKDSKSLEKNQIKKNSLAQFYVNKTKLQNS